jgi:hypothetical protein
MLSTGSLLGSAATASAVGMLPAYDLQSVAAGGTAGGGAAVAGVAGSGTTGLLSFAGPEQRAISPTYVSDAIERVHSGCCCAQCGTVGSVLIGNDVSACLT